MTAKVIATEHAAIIPTVKGGKAGFGYVNNTNKGNVATTDAVEVVVFDIFCAIKFGREAAIRGADAVNTGPDLGDIEGVHFVEDMPTDEFELTGSQRGIAELLGDGTNGPFAVTDCTFVLDTIEVFVRHDLHLQMF